MRAVGSVFAAWLVCVIAAHAASEVPVTAPGEATTTALNLAAPEALLDLGPSLSARDVNDPSDPDDAWFTVPVQNRGMTPVIRVLTAADRPQAALAISPTRTRPTLIEAVSSNPDIGLERSPGFGEHTFRLVIPPNNAGTLALHFQGVRDTPSLLAWSEPALVAHNRQYAVLTGLVSGLLIAATAFAAGIAILSRRAFAGWAALFLAAIVVGELSRTGFFDASWLTAVAGPYALSAFALSVGLACGIWLVDYVAPFAAFSPRLARLRDWVGILILLIGVAAFVGVPYAGVTVRALAVVGAAAAAGYLAHCGRLGISGARRLAPAAAIFALVTAAAMLNAFGFFGGNIVAPGAIGGFSAAGALLVALAASVPIEPRAQPLQKQRKANRTEKIHPVTKVREQPAQTASETAGGPSDALTGLGTRAALISFLDASPNGLKHSALALFDIERFKAINDSLGQHGGDTLLLALVERIKAGLNRGQLFRVSGGMFAMAETDVADLAAFGRRIFDMTSAPFTISGREIYVQASVGVAPGSNSERGRDLLFDAERALGEAKREGGSRVALYSAALAKAPSRDPVALETDLRHALERDEIEVYYQPIVRLKDGAIAGFEALLRWRHPHRGVIEPDEFIAHAERSDLIVNLGRQALRQAAKDLSRWQQFFPSRPPLYVSVNVTWRQIADEGFAKELGQILSRAGLAKDSLRLEVTESAVMAGAESAEAGLQRLKAMGASLALDDFGTGHSSLSQLARLPFDTLKIDKSFMVSVRHDAAGPKVLASILSLAHELKLVAIAEGVESVQEVTLLKALGCDQGQGFLFGAPMPSAQVFGFIASAKKMN
jgi:diguanylate cyclase (GGDEF)-like protein